MKNKKGIFFTIGVIAIISLFLIGYTFYSSVEKRRTVHERIDSLNTFIYSIEENFQRQIYISGFRAIFVMQTEAVQKGQYIQNATYSFNEMFYNGTFNNVEQSIMYGAKFSNIQANIENKADKVNADIVLSNPHTYLNQTDPWNVDVVINVNFYARDEGNLVSWNKTKTYIAKVPITDFEDPLYLISTSGAFTNNIERTPFTFSNGTNITQVYNHTMSKYYKASTTAPSYLDRLQGTNSPNPNGIESFVYIPGLSNQGITIQDKSIVDYIYFSTNSPAKCQISGMPPWFKIDQPHVIAYNVSGLETCV